LFSALQRKTKFITFCSHICKTARLNDWILSLTFVTLNQRKMDEHSSDILVVAATIQEIIPLLEYFRADYTGITFGGKISLPGTRIEVLLTGPGIAATCCYSSILLRSSTYKLAINAGLAGVYHDRFGRGTVLWVTHDRFSDFGAEEGYGFIPGEKLSFTHFNQTPFVNGWLIPSSPPEHLHPTLETCRAITSDTVHTRESSIALLRKLYDPDLETMEGAAFIYACMLSNTSCIQIRAISNHVGPRTSENWQAQHAIRNLNEFLIEYLQNL
jgi:futalosine hydrolase